MVKFSISCQWAVQSYMKYIAHTVVKYRIRGSSSGLHHPHPARPPTALLAAAPAAAAATLKRKLKQAQLPAAAAALRFCRLVGRGLGQQGLYHRVDSLWPAAWAQGRGDDDVWGALVAKFQVPPALRPLALLPPPPHQQREVGAPEERRAVLQVPSIKQVL